MKQLIQMIFRRGQQTPVERLLAQVPAAPQSPSPAPATAMPQAADVQTGSSSTAVQRVGGEKRIPSSRKITSLVGEGACLRGNFVTADSFHVSGRLEGHVHVTESGGAFSLTTTGIVEGTISAESVLIGGRVIGAIRARTLRLFPSALVEGDVFCDRLLIDDGARLVGRSRRFEEAVFAEGAVVDGEKVQNASPVDGEAPAAEEPAPDMSIDDLMDRIAPPAAGAAVVELGRRSAA